MFLTTFKLRSQPEKKREVILTLQELSRKIKSNGDCAKADLYQEIDDKNTLYFVVECQVESKLTASKFLTVVGGMKPLLLESVEITRAGII